MNTFTQACASLALAATLALASAAVVQADPPAGKGNDKSSSQGGAEQHGQSGQKGQAGDHGKDDADKHGYDADRSDRSDRYDGKDSSHGEVVSECNHRANERNLKGQDRKEWTEWCEERGSRHNYDYKRYSSDRNCYQKADNKGLTGDKRRKFINDCLDVPNRY